MNHRSADATSHLFFAYLRSLAPEGQQSVVSILPRSLLALLDSISYPSVNTLKPVQTLSVTMTVDFLSKSPAMSIDRLQSILSSDYSDTNIFSFIGTESLFEIITSECEKALKDIDKVYKPGNMRPNTSLGTADSTRFSELSDMNSLISLGLIQKDQPLARPALRVCGEQ